MSRGRILIVDDSDNIRSVLQMNFEWLGYQVTCAHDGEEALEMVRKEPPDLIILDVMMPRRNGYQVCRTIKADPAHTDIPVIFLTAKDQKEDRFWGKDCGADEYLTKPFSAAKLEKVIEDLFARRQAVEREREASDRMKGVKSSGKEVTSMTFGLDRKALAIFRQKYGEIRFSDAMEALRSTIEIILRTEFEDFAFERIGDAGFQAILPCGAARAESIATRIRSQGDLLLRSLYEGDDSERGFVVGRTSASSPEVHVPLLSLEVRLGLEVPAA